MTRSRYFRIFGLLSCVVSMLTVTPGSAQNPPGGSVVTLAQAKAAVGVSFPGSSCNNSRAGVCLACEWAQLHTLSTVTNSSPGVSASDAATKISSGGSEGGGAVPLDGSVGSFVENISFTHYHLAVDYTSVPRTGGGGGCGSGCGSGGNDPNSGLGPPLEIVRHHRHRNVVESKSSFGQGVFCNYDIHITLVAPGAMGSWTMKVFDPQDYFTRIMHDPMPSDGIWTPKYDYTFIKQVTLKDTNGNTTSSPSSATTAELLTYSGNLFKFQFFSNASGDKLGRLTRIENRNGYGVTLTYKTWTPAEITASPERQWQIDTVTDALGRSAVFSYHTSQVGGRWVVSSISLPGSRTVSYAYGTDKLTSVTHPNSAQSTFSYTVDSASQCTIYSYNDPTSTASREDAYLSNQNLFIGSGETFFYTVSSMIARIIVNGNNEVVYFSQYDGATALTNSIYEGGGVAKLVSANNDYARYLTTWTWTSNTITNTGTESTYATTGTTSNPSSITDQQGRQTQYVYDSDKWPTTITYSTSPSVTETFTYNGFKQVLRHKDRNGNVTLFTYDTRGNLTKREVGILDNGSGGNTNQPEYAFEEWGYYATGHVNQYLLAWYKDHRGNQTDYIYDSSDRLVTIRQPADTAGGTRAETTFTYDSLSRLSTAADPVSRVTTYNYSNMDQVSKIIYNDTSTDRFIFGTGNDSLRPIKAKDRNGFVTKFEYDASGRRNKTVHAYATMDLSDNETLITDVSLKQEETCSFLAGTTRQSSCTRMGDTTTFVYDYRHRLVETTPQARTTKSLTNRTVFSNNEVFYTEDPYGRKTYSAYRSWDGALIKQVQGTVPGFSLANYAAVTSHTRTADPHINGTSLVTDYALDNNGQTTTLTDPRGFTHTTSYDSRNRVTTQVRDSATVAAQTTTIYDAASNVIEVRDPRYFDSTDPEVNKVRTTMTYNFRNLLASRTEGTGSTVAATESFTYKLDGRQDVHTDFRNNNWSTIWHACCGRQQASVNPLGHGTITNNDYAGNVTHQITVSDVTSHNANYHSPIDAKTLQEVTTRYDARHRPSKRTVWKTARGVVDPNNPPIAEGATAGDGFTTVWTYDDDLDDGVGLDASFSTHMTGLGLGAGSDGSAVLVTDPDSDRTLSIRDGVGRTVRTIQLDTAGTALNNTTTSYDTVVNVTLSGMTTGDVVETAVSNALGHTTKSRVDGAGRTIQAVDALANITTFEYDAGGNQKKFRDPNSTGQDCNYDGLGRQTQCSDTYSTPSTTQTTYDKNSNVKTRVDAKSVTTSYVYDARNRRKSETDRISGVTQWAYDANGNLLTLTDAQSQATAYSYSTANEKLTETYPDHVAGSTPGQAGYGIITYTYDAASRIKTRQDQLGDTVTMNYDLPGRLTSRDYRLRVNSPSGTIADTDTFTYDNDSRMLTAVSGRYANTLTFTYDDAGRMATEALLFNSQTYTVTRNYDTANRLTKISFPDGSTSDRVYTNRHQLQETKYDADGPGAGAAASVTTFGYDNGGRETTRTFGNGRVTTTTYRTDNLVNTMFTAGITGLDYTYGYDANKNKTSEAINSPMTNYGFSTGGTGYDAEDRLTVWNRTGGGKNQSWALSLVGDWNTFTENSTNQSRTHGLAHELNVVAGVNLAYDAKGNLVTHSNAQTYTWDFDNHLKSTVVPSGAPGTVGTHTYGYDALGRRIRKTVGSTTTVYVSLTVPTQGVPAEQIAAEYISGQPASNPERKYIYGSYIDEPLLYIDATGMSEIKWYCHRNSLYCVTALTDTSGAVQERYAYSAYGEPAFLNGAGTPLGTQVSAKGNPYTYTGRAFDNESRQYYYRARMYDHGLGRFAQRDPVGLSAGPNIYHLHRALVSLDPTGAIVTQQTCHRLTYPFKSINYNIHLGPLRIDIGGQIGLAGEACQKQCANGEHVFDWSLEANGQGSIEVSYSPWRISGEDPVSGLVWEAWAGGVVTASFGLTVSGGGGSDKCSGVAGAAFVCVQGSGELSLSIGAFARLRTQGGWSGVWSVEVGAQLIGSVHVKYKRCWNVRLEGATPMFDPVSTTICYGGAVTAQVNTIWWWGNWEYVVWSGEECITLAE